MFVYRRVRGEITEVIPMLPRWVKKVVLTVILTEVVRFLLQHTFH